MGAIACGPAPCLPADAVEISVASGTRPELKAEVAAGIAAYRRWSGQPAPCLRSLTVESELWVAGLPAEGQLIASERRLRIGPTTEDGAQVTLHELCHLWDADAGRPSEDATLGARLPPLPENPAYPGHFDRRHESFARLCAMGPVDPALAGARPDCGDADPALLAEIGARVWPATAPALRTLSVERVVEAQAVPLAPLLAGASLLRAAPCGDRLCALVLGASPDLLTEGSFPAPWDRLALALLVIDPAGPTLLRGLPVPRRDEAGWSLWGGPEGVLLVEAGEGTRAWWLPRRGGAPQARSLPACRPGPAWTGGPGPPRPGWRGPWAPVLHRGEIGHLDLTHGALTPLEDRRLPEWGPGGLLRSTALPPHSPPQSLALQGPDGPLLLAPGRGTSAAIPLENEELALFVEGVGWLRRRASGDWLRAAGPCLGPQLPGPVLSIGGGLWTVEGGPRAPVLRPLPLPG